MNKTMPLHCQVCNKKIGSINPEAGIFDSRYEQAYNNHICKEYYKIIEIKEIK